jgi:hypothetical protein
MVVNPESIDFRNKVMEGVTKAVRNLVISSAEKNEKLVVSDKEGNVKLVDAKELLKGLPQTEKI